MANTNMKTPRFRRNVNEQGSLICYILFQAKFNKTDTSSWVGGDYIEKHS